MGHLLFIGGIGMLEVLLINTGLAEQFIIHVKVAMCAGITLRKRA